MWVSKIKKDFIRTTRIRKRCELVNKDDREKEGNMQIILNSTLKERVKLETLAIVTVTRNRLTQADLQLEATLQISQS